MSPPVTANGDAEIEEKLWHRFLLGRAAADRALLIERHVALARRIADKLFAGRQVHELEREDFRQYAMLGLVESVDRYDPSRGASFATYCSHRIRGAILNGIEKHSERQQQIAARARLRAERFGQLLKEAAAVEQEPFLRLVETAIGVAIGYMLEDSRMYQADEGSYEHNIYRHHEMRDLARTLSDLVETLPEQERSMIRYHYFQRLRFEDIAQTMGLSKGRISQIHHQALRRMQEHYAQLRLLRTDY